MSILDPSHPDYKAPTWGCLIYAAPLVAVPMVFAAYGYLFYSGLGGRPADGARVEIAFDGCEAAGPIIEARVQRMGLGDPVFGTRDSGPMIEVTLPTDEEVANDVPTTLARTGAFEIRAGDEVLFDNSALTDATVRMDIMMSPWVVLRLQEDAEASLHAHQKTDLSAETSYWIDGVKLGRISNQKTVMGGEVELPGDAANDRARMQRAAADALVLSSGPLPCSVSVVSVHPASLPGS